MILHRADSRGKANLGWLNSHHSFSFGSWFDPTRMNFGTLRVLNDDIVAAGRGFGKHPHDNMEIISIPTHGALMHEDSMGHNQTLSVGEVQVMSAGTGLSHAEFNASEKDEVRFFQIWIMPREKNVAPRYDQKEFSEKEGHQLLVSPDGSNDSLWINQDAWISRYRGGDGAKVDYTRYGQGTGVYVFNIAGSASGDGFELNARDAVGFEVNEKVQLTVQSSTDLLILEVPMG